MGIQLDLQIIPNIPASINAPVVVQAPAEMRKRYHLCLLNSNSPSFNPSHPRHVFDFEDGLRLVIWCQTVKYKGTELGILSITSFLSPGALGDLLQCTFDAADQFGVMCQAVKDAYQAISGDDSPVHFTGVHHEAMSMNWSVGRLPNRARVAEEQARKEGPTIRREAGFPDLETWPHVEQFADRAARMIGLFPPEAQLEACEMFASCRKGDPMGEKVAAEVTRRVKANIARQQPEDKCRGGIELPPQQEQPVRPDHVIEPAKTGSVFAELVRETQWRDRMGGFHDPIRTYPYSGNGIDKQ